MPHMSAIETLADLPGADRLKSIGEGVTHLAANVERLDQAAHSLSAAGDPSTAALLGHFAAEEAAKILLLLDVVRCPPEQSSFRRKLLRRYNDHLWKGIYVRACDWHPADFGELKGYVESECEPFYLDGPVGVDWIFPNEIAYSRESLIYVDYLQDTSEPTDGEPQRWWAVPGERSQYVTSNCVQVALSLFGSGFGTDLGLDAVADIWNDFDLQERTSIGELYSSIRKTLETMATRKVFPDGRPSEADISTIFEWPFPLWSLVDVRVEYDRKRNETYVNLSSRHEKKTVAGSVRSRKLPGAATRNP